MFPRSLRLGRKGIEQSRRLFRTTTPHFSISYGALQNNAGLAVIVPKKAVRKAVTRHQVKRRLREVLRLLSKNAVVPSTIVVAARAGSDTLTSAEIHDELSSAFRDILAETK